MELIHASELMDSGTSNLRSTSLKCQTIRSAELHYSASIFTLNFSENQDFMTCRGKYFNLFHNILDASSIISNVY